MRVLKYLSFLLMVVALVGFYQSSSLHLNIVRSPNESASENWWLNNGFFVVWIPAMFALYQLSKNINERIINERDPWKVILGSGWIKVFIWGI